MLKTRRLRRSLPKLPFLSLQVLEGRDVPAAIIVNPTFDNNTPGWQVTAFNKVSDAFAIAAAADTIDIQAGDYTVVDTATANLTVAAAVTVSGAATVSAIGATAGTIALTADLTVGNTANTSIAAVLSGAGKFVKQGPGTITLSADNSTGFTGAVQVNSGILAVGNINALGSTATGTTVADGGTLEVATTGTVTAEPINLTGQGSTGTNGALRNSVSATWSGPIPLGTGGARINSGADTFTISGAVGAAAEALTLGGSNKLSLTGVITATGQVNFTGGNFVSVTGTSNNATFTAPILINNNTIVSYATVSTNHPLGTQGLVTVDGGTLQQTTPTFALNFISSTRNISVGANGATFEYTNGVSGNLNIIQNTAPGTVISGTGEVRFKGPGTIALAMPATYTGPTRILNGAFARTRGTNFTFPITQALIVDDGGTFEYSSTGQLQQAISLEGAGKVNFTALTGSRLTINNTVATPVPDKVFTGTIIGSGGFIMNGNGTQTLAGASTYTNVTTVTNGTLLAGNSTGSAFGTGALTVAAAGTLGSVSTSNNGIASNVHTINGSLAPGNVGTTGRYTVNNNVTFGATGQFKVDLRGTTAGFGASGFDQLVVSGTTTITDGAKLLLDLTGYTPTPGNSWKIIDNNGGAITTRFRDANGTLLDQNTEFLIGADLYRISYTGGDGNDVVITRALPASTYFVRKDFNTSAIDLDSGAPGIQVDGNPLDPLEPLATVGVNAFDTIMAAVNASTVNGDKIIVSADALASTYAEQVDLGAKELLVTFQENPITINSIKGTNKLAAITLGTKADLVTGILVTMGGDDLSTDLAASISGPGGIVKIGNGTLTFSPVANTYTGSTSIATAGTGAIKAGSTGAFSSLSPFDLSDKARLILNGFNNSVGNLTAPVGAIVENTGTTTAILTAGSTKIADQSTFDLNFAGTLQDGGTGSLGFVKVGAGVLTLPATNGFTGPFGLLGGTYTVDTLPNGGVPGPFGASTNAATNFRLGGGKLVYTGPAIPAPGFDRNITWFTATGTIESANDITFAGTITGSTNQPGGFIKEGAGKLTFTALDALQAPNSGTAYGKLGTGNITVNGGELIAQNITVRGIVTGRAAVNYVGSRILTINTGTTVTIKNTLALDPDAAYVSQVTGAGTLAIDTPNASKTNPSITFDSGPNVSNVGGGDIRPLGSVIAANVNLVGTSKVFITGKANRNDLNRHSGDLRFNNKITGSAPIQFVGLTSTNSSRLNDANASNIHFVLNASNEGSFTGGVFLANADLALGAAKSLTADNSLTFNSEVDANTRNRASLFLFGENFTIGSLNDTSAVGTTANIRNGSRDTATGGTGTSTGNALGAQLDSTLTIIQSVAGTFGGDFSNGPNDNPEDVNSAYKGLSVIKEGPASLTLSGTSPVATTQVTNLQAANITVNAGTLVHNGTITTPTQTITVGADGTFGGAGSIQGLSVAGRLSPGTVGGAGTLTLGSVSFPGTAEVVVDINGLTAGTQYDQLKVSGAIDLTGAKLTVNETIVAPVPIGTRFVIVDNTGTGPIVGTFNGLPEGATFIAGGTKFEITYLDGGNDCACIAVPNFTPPVVSGFSVNNGATQRSRVTNITVSFAGAVSPGSFTAAGDIRLTRYVSTPTGVNGTIVETGATGANGLITVTQPGPLTELVLSFSNADLSNVTSGVEFGSLADGRWELTIPSATYASGQPTSPNAPLIHRLFGDVDANATVDTTDFSFFPPFGSVAGNPFDFNNNSDIDSGTDFSEFGNRFGFSL